MQALQLSGWKREPELVEVADPTPAPGQVLVKIGGAGACHSDLHLMHDFDGLPMDFPFTLGHENAGWVEALGAGVTGLEIGQPVAVFGPGGCGRCVRCAQGLENYCEVQGGGAAVGLGMNGGMAPLMLVPAARHCVPLADGLDPVAAAPLTDAGLTPYHAVKRSLAKLGAGSHAVVIGAGGLGHIAVQVLNALCAATVIVVDQKEDALKLASSVGAHHTVLAGDGAADEIRGHTKGKGADVVLDLVGTQGTLALAVSVARPLGDVTLVGIGGGSHSFSFFTTPYEVSLQSTYWGSLPELHEVLTLAARGAITTHVQRFSLDQAADAYRALHQGTLTGRAVIVPN